jgi:hypothetical protein
MASDAKSDVRADPPPLTNSSSAEPPPVAVIEAQKTTTAWIDERVRKAMAGDAEIVEVVLFAHGYGCVCPPEELLFLEAQVFVEARLGKLKGPTVQVDDAGSGNRGEAAIVRGYFSGRWITMAVHDQPKVEYIVPELDVISTRPPKHLDGDKPDLPSEARAAVVVEGAAARAIIDAHRRAQK